MISELLKCLAVPFRQLLFGAAWASFAVVALWYYRSRLLISRLKAQGMKESPFPRSPLFGHALHMRRLGFSRFVLESALKLGPEDGRVFITVIGPTVYLLSTDPDVMQTVAKTENLPKGQYTNLLPTVGNGLLTNRGGDDWTRKRQLFNPAFSVPYLKQVAPPAITAICAELVRKIEAKGQAPVDIHRLLCMGSLDLIGLVGFGYDFGCTKGKVKADVLHMMHVCLQEPTTRLLNPLARFYRVRETLDFHKQLRLFTDFSLQIIRANRTGRDGCATEKQRNNIMGLALGSGGGKGGCAFSDQQLVDEVSTFLFAGHETTSATMCFAIMLLGVHTDWQNKARQEVDRVLGDRMSPTHEDQLQLKTLTMILKETLRLFPAAPGTVRITEKATPVIHFVLPPKVHIMPVFMAMQRHPKNFANPLKFDPTRWQTNKTAEEIDENVEEGSPKDKLRKEPAANNGKKHPYAFVPFSAGPRNCIGMHFATMEMRMLIAHLLRRFTWTVEFPGESGHIDPIKVLEHYSEEVTLRAKPFDTYFSIRNA